MKKMIICIVLTLVVIVLVLFANLKLFEKQSLKISQGEPIKKYTVEKSAILVIDIQEAITGKLSPGTRYSGDSDSLISLKPAC